jgi:hypothetical protein
MTRGDPEALSLAPGYEPTPPPPHAMKHGSSFGNQSTGTLPAAPGRASCSHPRFASAIDAAASAARLALPSPIEAPARHGRGAGQAARWGYWVRLDNPARGVERPADVGGRAMMNTRCSAGPRRRPAVAPSAGR